MTPLVRFLQVLEALKARPDAISLAAGDPLLVEPLGTWVQKALEEIASNPPAIGRYEDYDGLPMLLDRLQVASPIPDGSERMVTVGAQSALTLLQRAANDDGAAGAYPLGVEFSGACNLVATSRVGHLQLMPMAHGNGPVLLADVAPPRVPEDARAGDMLFLSVPNNPTGGSWSRDELQALTDDGCARGITTVFDATYALPGASIGGPFEPPDGDQVCTVRSFSKVGLAGERIGILDGPHRLVQRIRGLQRASYIQVPRLGQVIATHLLDRLATQPAAGEAFADVYRQRWQLALDVLDNTLDRHVSAVRWRGGPFLFLSCDGIPWERGDELFHHLLAKGVAVAPGSTFACGPSPSRNALLRLGIGAIGAENDDPSSTLELLAEGMRRVALGLNTLDRKQGP